MSMNVDERVVQMYFDNDGFNDGVSESMTLLEKFQNALSFRGASKGFDAVQMAANSLNFSGIQNAVETVQMKFSAFEVIAVTALSNITSLAMSAGEAMVKSLSLDQITSGWNKYESIVENTQAIMSATDESMETVQDKLSELNWFSDETSYGLSDMTSAVQKFTAAGVDLDKAVPAIEGIATWAAYSGVSARRAAGAFYNMAQAVGKGMQGVDWRSIELLNMNTPKFMQTALDKGVELGKLVKTTVQDGEQLYKVVGATGKKAEEFGLHTFRDSLSSGWFDQDTIVSTLDAFGGYAHALYQTTDAYDTCAEAMEHFTWEHKDYGEAAFKAAQEAKTFTDAIEATKDAVSTGWMQTFQYIFGNYEEAKVLWTDVTGVLWDVFASSGEVRNHILKEWHDLGGRTELIQGIANIWENFSGVASSIKDAFDEIFPHITGQELYDATKRFQEFTDKLILAEPVLEDIGDSAELVFAAIKKPIDYLKDIGGNVLGSILEVLPRFRPILDSMFPEGFSGFLENIGEKFTAIRESFFEPWMSKVTKVTKSQPFKLFSKEEIQDLEDTPGKLDSLSKAGRSLYDASKKRIEDLRTAAAKFDVPNILGRDGLLDRDALLELDSAREYLRNSQKPIKPVGLLSRGEIEELKDSPKALTKVQQSLLDASKKYWAALDTMPNKYTKAEEKLTFMSEHQLRMQNAIAKVHENFKPVDILDKDEIRELESTPDKLSKAEQVLINASKQYWEKVDAETERLSSFKPIDLFKPLDTAQFEKIDKIVENISSFVDNIYVGIANAAWTIENIIGIAGDSFHAVFPDAVDINLIDVALDKILEVTDYLKDFKMPALTLGSPAQISAFFDDVALHAKSFVDGASETFENFKKLFDLIGDYAGAGLSTIFDGIFDGLKNIPTEPLESFVDMIGGILMIPNNIAVSLYNIIEAIKDAAELTGFVDAVKELFDIVKDILPDMSDFRFPALENFAKLEPGQGLWDLFQILKGIFSVFTLGIDVITGFYDAFKPIVDDIFSAIGGALDKYFPKVQEFLGDGGLIRMIADFAGTMAASMKKLHDEGTIGKWFGDLANALRISYDILKDIFGPLISGIYDFFSAIIMSGDIDFTSIGTAITSFFTAILNAISSFFSIDTEKVFGFWEKLKGYGEKLGPFFSGIIRLLQGLWDIVSLVAPVFGWLAEGIGEGLSYIAEGIGNFLDNVGLFDAAKGIWRLANGTALVAFAASFKKFVDTISDGVEIADALKDVPVLGSVSKFMKLMSSSLGESFKEILSPITEVLSAMQDKLRGETLKEIAIAIGILAASIFVLSMLPTTQLGMALATIWACANILTQSLSAVVKGFQETGLDIKMVASMGKLLIMLAISVAILAGSMRLLSDIPWPNLVSGGIALAGIMAALYYMGKNLPSRAEGMKQTAISLLIISVAVRVLAGALKKVGEIPWEGLFGGTLALLGLMWGLTEVAKHLAEISQSDQIRSAAGGMLLMAIGVRILAGAVKAMGELSWKQLVKGLGGVAAILVELSAAVWFMTKVADLEQFGVSVGLGLMLAAVGVAIMGKAIKGFADSKPGDLGRGILALAGAMTVLVIAMNFMPDNMLALGAGLMIASIGLIAMAAAIKILQTDDWTKFGTGVLSLVIGLTALTVCLHFLANPMTLAGAAALTIASVGLIGLSVAIGILSAIGIPGVITGLVALAGTFMILNIFAPGLAASALGILGLAGSLAALSGSAILGALAIAACSAALYLLGATVGFIVSGIASSLDKAGDFIYRLFHGLATDSVDAMNDTLEIHSPSKVFMRIGGFIIQGLVDGVLNGLPNLMSVFGGLGSSVIDFFGNALSGIFGGGNAAGDGATAMGEGIVNNMLSGMQSSAPDISGTMSEVMGEFDPTKFMPDMTQAGFDMSTMFGDGMFDASGYISEAAAGLGVGANDTLAPYMDQFAAAGGEGAFNYADLMAQYIPNAEAAADGVGSGSMDALSAYTGQYGGQGSSSGENFASGLRGTAGRVSIATSEMDRRGVYAAQVFLPQWYQVGSDSTTGFKNGLLSKASAVGEAAALVANTALNSARAAVDSHSPSKKFIKLGEDSDRGLIIGLMNLSSNVRDAGGTIGESALAGLDGIADRAQAAIGQALENGPTITPILDLSDISQKASRINSMLPDSYAFDAFGRIENRAAFDQLTDTAIAATNQNGGTINSLLSLHDDIASLGDRIENMAMNLDGNKLVGYITNRMDRSLGRRAAYKARGI